MNNIIQVIDTRDANILSQIESQFSGILCKGWVYAIKFGEYVKIGCSSHLAHRYRSISHLGNDYGDQQIGTIILSPACVNYQDLEKQLHKKFETYRKDNTELFSISASSVLSAMNNLTYDTDFAQADKKLNQRSNQIITFGKSLLSGAVNNILEVKSHNSSPSVLNKLCHIEFCDDCFCNIWVEDKYSSNPMICVESSDGDQVCTLDISIDEAVTLAQVLLNYATSAPKSSEQQNTNKQ